MSLPEKTQKLRPKISVVVSQARPSNRSIGGVVELGGGTSNLVVGEVNLGDTLAPNVLYPTIIYD